MNEPNIYVTDTDRQRLGVLLATPENRAWGEPRSLDELEVLLEHAEELDASVAPDNLVTMNSTVELVDFATGDLQAATLVYPKDVDLAPNAISVFDPLGMALLGCQEGDVVEYTDEQDETRTLRVARIVYQPEQSGARHL